jgi:membrane protein DedA with SNARE-associated domain
MHIILIYIGILAGTFFEGEMVMLSSVIAAHHGHLNLWIVLFIGLCGTLAADWTYFFLGRRRGKNWLMKKEKWKNKSQRISGTISRYPILVIIIYRFLYGFRAITPIIIGSGDIKTPVFLTYSFVSTLLWCATYGAMGYLFGAIIKNELSHIENVEFYFIGGLVLLGVIIYVIKKRYTASRAEII